jgi:hypothetical protein
MAALLGLALIAATVWVVIWAVRTVLRGARGWQQALLVLACFVIPFVGAAVVIGAVVSAVRDRKRRV